MEPETMEPETMDLEWLFCHDRGWVVAVPFLYFLKFLGAILAVLAMIVAVFQFLENLDGFRIPSLAVLAILVAVSFFLNFLTFLIAFIDVLAIIFAVFQFWEYLNVFLIPFLAVLGILIAVSFLWNLLTLLTAYIAVLAVIVGILRFFKSLSFFHIHFLALLLIVPVSWLLKCWDFLLIPFRILWEAEDRLLAFLWRVLDLWWFGKKVKKLLRSQAVVVTGVDLFEKMSSGASVSSVVRLWKKEYLANPELGKNSFTQLLFSLAGGKGRIPGLGNDTEDVVTHMEQMEYGQESIEFTTGIHDWPRFVTGGATFDKFITVAVKDEAYKARVNGIVLGIISTLASVSKSELAILRHTALTAVTILNARFFVLRREIELAGRNHVRMRALRAFDAWQTAILESVMEPLYRDKLSPIRLNCMIQVENVLQFLQARPPSSYRWADVDCFLRMINWTGESENRYLLRFCALKMLNSLYEGLNPENTLLPATRASLTEKLLKFPPPAPLPEEP